ncbi:hypothetical protein C1X65_13335 [Pseudomonas sp. FW305-70]|nr:hypothetical protein C1X65_13335 [Pseudomonas sp. FW305-70]
MVVNDNAGSLAPSGVFKSIASKLAPTWVLQCLFEHSPPEYQTNPNPQLLLCPAPLPIRGCAHESFLFQNCSQTDHRRRCHRAVVRRAGASGH